MTTHTEPRKVTAKSHPNVLVVVPETKHSLGLFLVKRGNHEPLLFTGLEDAIRQAQNDSFTKDGVK